MKISLALLLVVGLAVTIDGNPVRQSRGLHDDLNDFLALVPKEKVLEIFNEYVISDKEVQAAIDYILSEEFVELYQHIANMEYVRALVKYLHESGLDVYRIINVIHDFLGIDLIVPKNAPTKITGGVAGLVADIKAVLPNEQIKALYHVKLETSVDFKKLVDRLSSDEFQQVINAVFENEEFQGIIKKLKSYGVDVAAVAEVLNTIFGLEFPAIPKTRVLHDDLDDFLALVPKDKIVEIFFEYLKSDAEVQFVVEYITSDSFKELVQAMESIPDVINFYKYLHESGLDVYRLVNKLHGLIDLPPLNPSRSTVKITGGVAGLIADIKAILPLDKIKALYHEKLQTSADFKKLIERLQSPKFQAVIDALVANEQFQKIIAQAKKFGVDVAVVSDLLSTIFGLKFPEHKLIRALHDDLDDFLALVPKEKVLKIFNEYVISDKEVQAAIDYILSEEFVELYQHIANMEYVRALVKYLHESGLDVYRIINVIHDFLGIAPIVPKNTPTKITGGVAGLVADIKAVLPIEQIKALYHVKLETSVDFKKLVDRLSSDEFQQVINVVFANEEFQEIIKKIKSYGVDVAAVAEVLNTIFGLEFPAIPKTRALHDDLDDFLALVPKDKIVEIFFEYLKSDAEVQFVVEYITSDSFKELVQAMESIPDVINFYKYLHESGLDVYRLVNKLHGLIGLPPLNPSRSTVKITGGVAGLIADIKAILPLNKIKALYHEKLQTSADFKKLIERLQSPKFQAVIDALVANEQFQKIIDQAKKFGVDVAVVSDLLSTIFGLKFPEHKFIRALHDDFADFLALIPQGDVMGIFYEYLQKDEQVQFVVEYIQSAEFRELVKVVEAIPDVINFYDYLQESGLNVYGLVNLLHDLIGLPPLVPVRSLTKITGGVAGLIADIKAFLPLEDIKNLYYEKLETSVEFKNMIERLKSPKFQAVVDTLLANKEFQEILMNAKEFGVDVAAVADLLTTALGINWSHNENFLFNTSNLQQDFDDFILLLPFEEITRIGLHYLLTDEGVQQAAEYVKSNEFRGIIVRLQNDPEVYSFLEYLQDSGVDIFDSFNLLNDLLGWPHFPESFRGFTIIRADGGVHAMLEDIRAVLPLDKIKSMYEDKLITSENFRYFIERLKSPEFQQYIDILVVNKNMIDLGYQAQQHGIVIEHIVQFMGDLFGIQFPEPPWFPVPSRSTKSLLADDLQDFLLLLPVEELVELTAEYIIHDEEMQNVYRYLRSENFKKLIKDLNEIPEYHDILEELNTAGLNVYEWMKNIHDLIDWRHYHTMDLRTIQKPGLSGLIKAIKALLPHAEIKALYHDKLKNSEAFRKLVALISSEKFQKLTNTLFANKEFQHLLHQAQAYGVNLQLISDLFFNIFGITTPPGVINFY